MNWWGGSPSVLLEKKGLSPNERTGTKSLDANIKWLLNGEIGAVGVETKLSCPGHSQLVNSIGTSFDIELARTRASTGSGAGQGGPVEDEVGKLVEGRVQGRPLLHSQQVHHTQHTEPGRSRV